MPEYIPKGKKFQLKSGNGPLQFKMMGSTPAKQLHPDYMGSEAERDFYMDYEKSKHYEPVPSGTYRGIGEYQKYTGPDTFKEGDFGPTPDKKTGDVISLAPGWSTPEGEERSRKIGPVESDEMIEQRKIDAKKAEEEHGYFSDEAEQEETELREARKYRKR